MANLLRLSACLFVLLSFNAFAVDTDGDGFSDADEATLGTDPNDPTSPLENKLTASGGSSFDNFGYSVSIDGNTALVGAYQGDTRGSAYVYVRNNGVWSEQAKLTASDGEDWDTFGMSVSLDAGTALIGSRLHDNSSGSAYVFVRNNDAWGLLQKLTASDSGIDDNFGASVSIDGDTAVIGAQHDDTPNYNSGSAYVFIRNNGVWSEQVKLTASDGASNNVFGWSVSIDGDTAVIGSPFDNSNGGNSGSVYVFVRNDGVWTEQQKLTASNGSTGDEFGHSVSIDGDTAVIGAPQSGSAYIFTRSDGVWSEQQVLVESNGASNSLFGWSVSIDSDRAVVGSDNSGSAYVFVRSNGVWTEQQRLTASDGDWEDNFGSSVSLNGDTALIGAYGDTDNGFLSGSAYVFPLTPAHQDTPATITGATSANVDIGGYIFGTLIATDVDGLTDGTYFSIKIPPTYGQALINPSSGVWTFIANSTYAGFDPFTVTVTDDLGGTTEKVVSITITAPDSDGDGAYDHQDNCPSVSNADQANLDGDTFGDACDNDKDGDGFTSDFDLNDLNAFYSTDPDGDGVDSSGESHYTNNVCLRLPNCNENDPCVTVCYVPPQDNCPTVSNSDQNDLDNDNLGNACDSDADGDGLLFAVEDRLGGSDLDSNDVSFVLSNANTYFENAPADSDLDGVTDDIEAMLGEDNTTSTFQDLLDTLSSIATTKNVPAMGGIGLLALGLSMLGLGAVRLRKK
ncbi:MAG: Ig-like domain-containing protein [Pseudomonadota bacterium]|nr:Ig-like domain-containing protein [Pseudomonadota bacterium]